ncbi:MAG: hypothetical protein HY675_14260, partial [Chloroflexi bacterium]|nr:hypothetical protein [Chloroflexota bacterium]
TVAVGESGTVGLSVAVGKAVPVATDATAGCVEVGAVSVAAVGGGAGTLASAPSALAERGTAVGALSSGEGKVLKSSEATHSRLRTRSRGERVESHLAIITPPPSR